MISLSDLKSKRAAMRECVFPDGEDIVVTRIRKEWRPDLRDALVATHNAADVLIEIAEAALAFDLADAECSKLPPDLRDKQRARAVAQEQLTAALSKVTP